tara:strand:+ start:1185 stop:3023 length:1839 start_codon:yes stop_codon:yes gene_type:complete
MKLSRISLALVPLLTAFSATSAVYQVAELEPNNISKATFAAALNNQGDAVVTGQGLSVSRDFVGNNTTAINFINFPLDVETINFESAAITANLTAEQIADAEQGIFEAPVLNFLTVLLATNVQLTNQRVGSAVSILQPDNAPASLLPLRDVAQLRSNAEFIYDLNEQGIAVGIASAPFSKQAFTPAVDPDDEDAEAPETLTVWQPEAGFQYGVAVTDTGPVNLLPPYTDVGGGFSRAFSINNDNLIAGSGSVSLDEEVATLLETGCTDDSQPAVFCFNQEHSNRVTTFAGLQAQVRTNQTITSYPDGYQERAMLWQLQPDGSASVTQTFGFLGEKGNGGIYQPDNEHPEVFYYSTATAVNDLGIAVGHSMYSDSDRTIRFRDQFSGQEIRRIYLAPHATMYQNGEASALVDPQEWLASNAVDINNGNIVTGYAMKSINGFRRDKFFYYDIATDNLVFPADFFAGSTSIPAAINDNGQIVGRGEVIIGGTTTRRQHGFVYDIVTDTFSDLNTLLGCNSPYTVVDATAINNNGVILATVLQSQPRLDAKGETLLDDNGNPLLAEQAKAVKLLPIANGEAESCDSEQQTYERKAGGLGGVALILLAGIRLIRRKR